MSTAPRTVIAPQTTPAPPTVRVFDYLEQFAALRGEVLQAITGVLESGQLILGPRCAEFEQSMSDYLGGGLSCGVANGTDAIAIALRALGIGAGDEVLTVANTAIPTVSAIRMTGATPVFVDIDPRTLLLDLTKLEARMSPRTRAIVAVHLFGNAVDMPALLELAARRNLRVVEDCAQATGTRIGDRHVGTFGDMGCFSFYPTKNLGAYGDGGLCFTRSPQLAESVRKIRMYGCGRTYYAEQEGVNSRLDELQAAILSVKLRYLPAWVERRRQIAGLYDDLLAGCVERPERRANVEHSHHLYVVACDERDALVAHLKSRGVQCGIHYPTPIHRMSGYSFLNYLDGSLPATERAAQRIVSLPCYPELRDEAVQQVATAVREFVVTNS